ncbi:phosphoribosylformylglycinamidine (FGAM) synthase, glutamine amidotransferase domain [Cenarchaeum symbiosum A]|uniref:Phosphoribosylformylglycinamidine synthase subunit PurQ n=1 Tax=Cenarchaeum symbiosum (strain A) TaxID=414004 RepID=A0RYV4_CENSY|nr:phosphoribosylformylglycinamidine (FGAM) synthase, glutamine amidotransferase domain [Cenarchaeum symbiosum A]
MRIGVIVFPGSNCDRDVFHVLSDVHGHDARYVWHEEEFPADLEAVVLPGGFSYGDRLRAGVIAAHSPVMDGVRGLAERGVPVLGICNGFQILAEAGLLPGVLLKNSSLSFMCRWTELKVENDNTPFTSRLEKGQRVPIPVANGEGRYYADDETLYKMEENGQIVFRYAEDVNGSTGRIAGVCSEKGNVVGMMPHPERAAEPEINPVDSGPASLIFESLLSGPSS